MSNEFVLHVQSRSDAGKGASRRLRREAGLLPGVVYGGTQAPELITLELREITKALESEAFYSQVISLELDGKAQSVILRDLQRHPSKGVPIHADFQRVDATQKITVNIQLHFINEDKCVGVKEEGGQINHTLSEVEISALPADLPQNIVVDMANVKVGQIVHLSDLQLPKGVEIPALQQGSDHDQPVAMVMAIKGGDDSEEGESSEG